jgi:hypothetical protein
MYIQEHYMNNAVSMLRGVGFRGSDAALRHEITARLATDPGYIERLRASILGKPTTIAADVKRRTDMFERESQAARRIAERAGDIDECVRHEMRSDPKIDESTARRRVYSNVRSDPRHYHHIFMDEDKADEERARQAITPEGKRELRRREIARFRQAHADEREAEARGAVVADRLVAEEMWADQRLSHAEAALRVQQRLARNPGLMEDAGRDLAAREKIRDAEAEQDRAAFARGMRS